MSVSGPTITFGQEPNSNYPRAIVTSDGTLLATYEWNDGTTAKLVTKKSNDLGTSWTAPVEVLSWDAKKAQLRNPYLLQTSSGAILCAYLVRKIDKDGEPLHFNLDVRQSDKDVQSWHEIGSIVSVPHGNGVQGEWEPFLREAVDGRLQAYYSHELDLSDQDLVFRTSGDGGTTWGAFTTVSGGGVPDVRPGMPQVVSLDGTESNLLMVYESNAGDEGFRVWTQTSKNGGDSWDDPHIIFNPKPAGSPSGRPQAGGPGIAQLPGRLVVSFMTNQDQPDHNYNEVVNLDMKVISSTDSGATWSLPVKALSHAGWGGVTAVEGGVLVLGGTSEGTVVLRKVAYKAHPWLTLT